MTAPLRSHQGVVTIELLIVAAFCVTLVWFGLEGTRLANTFAELDKSMRAAARYASMSDSYVSTTALNIVRYGKPLPTGTTGTEVVPGVANATVAVCFISPTNTCSSAPTATDTDVEITVSNMRFTASTPLSSLNQTITLQPISVKLPALP